MQKDVKKRGRGRPPGSKNKKKSKTQLAKEAAEKHARINGPDIEEEFQLAPIKDLIKDPINRKTNNDAKYSEALVNKYKDENDPDSKEKPEAKYHRYHREHRHEEAAEILKDILSGYYYFGFSDYKVSQKLGVSISEAQRMRKNFFHDDLARARRDDAKVFVSDIFNDMANISNRIKVLTSKNEVKGGVQSDRVALMGYRTMMQAKLSQYQILKSLGWLKEVQYQKYQPEDQSKNTLEIIQKMFTANLNPLANDPKSFIQELEEYFPGITKNEELAKKYGFDGDVVKFIDTSREIVFDKQENEEDIIDANLGSGVSASSSESEELITQDNLNSAEDFEEDDVEDYFYSNDEDNDDDGIEVLDPDC